LQGDLLRALGEVRLGHMAPSNFENPFAQVELHFIENEAGKGKEFDTSPFARIETIPVELGSLKTKLRKQEPSPCFLAVAKNRVESRLHLLMSFGLQDGSVKRLKYDKVPNGV